MRPAIRILLATALPGCLLVAALAVQTDEPTRARQCAQLAPGQQAFIADGSFTLGASRQPLPDALPPVRTSVDRFWIDVTEVTNAEFSEFVRATGYVTLAERGEEPGSVVFRLPEGGVPGGWQQVAGTSWRQPLGPGSSNTGRERLPVVHIAYEDALAYAHWRGRDLPTETEWEFAARGGLDGATYPWGEKAPGEDGYRANTWQGPFPRENTAADGFAGAAPVGCYDANGYGLYDMSGNVWEWVKSDSDDTRGLLKGGSYLCSSDFCARYQPAARYRQQRDWPTSHIGFRTVCRGASCKSHQNGGRGK